MIAHICTFREMFIYPYAFGLLSGVLQFHTLGLPTVCFQVRSSGNKLPRLYFWESLNIPHVWSMILLDRGFLVDNFFLLALWVYQLIFWPPGFWWEICSWSYLGFLVHDDSFLSCGFQGSLCHWFLKFDHSVSYCGSLELILLGVCWAFEHLYSCLSSNLESLWPLLESLSAPFLSVFSFWEYDSAYILVYLLVPTGTTGPLGSVHFSSTFFLSVP